MIEKLELNHLRVLDAVHEHGSVSAAAEALEVSQQAVSLQLKRLRTLLGDPLFVRAGQAMVPTAYARLIQPHVRQLLALWHAMPLPAQIPLHAMQRTLSLCATDHAQRIVVEPLLRELRAAAPGVRVKISNIESAALVRRMQAGEIDLAFTSSAYLPEGLPCLPLFTERYVCVAARPLTEPGSPLPLAALVARDFLVVSASMAKAASVSPALISARFFSATGHEASCRSNQSRLNAARPAASLISARKSASFLAICSRFSCSAPAARSKSSGRLDSMACRISDSAWDTFSSVLAIRLN